MRKELLGSKETIDRMLNKDVRHLCYPWFKGSESCVRLSGDIGYKSGHWGIVGDRAINLVGDDPFHIRRMDENYIFSLPGKGRKPLYEVLGSKLGSLNRRSRNKTG